MAAVVALGDPTWINNPTYDAEELRRADGLLFAAGASAGVARSGVLSARDMVLSLSGNNLMVGAGGCVIGTAKGVYRVTVPTATIVGALTAADVTNPRRDRVIVEVLDPDNMGGASRQGQLRIIDGTPSATAASGGGFPAAPTTAFVDLGYVDVPKSGGGSPVLTITAPLSVAAGAPVPVRSQAEADALPKVNGLSRIRLDIVNRPIQVCDGTVWRCVSPVLRTDFSVGDLTNQSGTASRLVGTLPLGTRTYARIIRLQAQMGVTPAGIASGVSTVYAAVSLMQPAVVNAQGKTPISWTNPGSYILGATVDTGEILVPAGTEPLARLWIQVTSGSINTTVSGDGSITKFWAEERPADVA